MKQLLIGMQNALLPFETLSYETYLPRLPSRLFGGAETLSQGCRMSAKGCKNSTQGWRQVSYQLKTGTVRVFSPQKKKKKKTG
jgi:hypothetical protein